MRPLANPSRLTQRPLAALCCAWRYVLTSFRCACTLISSPEADEERDQRQSRRRNTSGSGTPTTGSTPLTIPMLTNGVREEHQRDRAGDQAREQRRRVRRDHHRAPDQQHVEDDQHDAADQPEFLAEHGEDEVGVALRQEVEVRLRAVEPALADERRPTPARSTPATSGSRRPADRGSDP